MWLQYAVMEDGALISVDQVPRGYIIEGRWAGARMPVGYMVNNRKYLPSGEENPAWRRFVPFEPYAEVVRAYFRIFLEMGGCLRKTMRRIRDERISFPDCKPPRGFKISYQLKKRGDGYYPNRTSVIAMLTNPVYAGHWCHKNVVLVWNNHPPIVSEDEFIRAFNYLSKYALTGDDNLDYRPAFQYARPDSDQEREAGYPLCAGLIYSDIEKWICAGIIFEQRNQCYLYVMNHNEYVGTKSVWARRATWIDSAVVSLFAKKLTDTFQADVWSQTIAELDQTIEHERKMKRAQLTALGDAMDNLIVSIATLTNARLIQEVEKRYEQMEQERQRLTSELDALERERHNRVTLERHMTFSNRR